MDIRLVLLIGLAIVSMATLPVWYYYKIHKRRHCEHDFKLFRICMNCGERERYIQDEPRTKESVEGIRSMGP